ncbi:hypothetical protein FAIPA1_70019 [Frankia sp. AiPs1]
MPDSAGAIPRAGPRRRLYRLPWPAPSSLTVVHARMLHGMIHIILASICYCIATFRSQARGLRVRRGSRTTLRASARMGGLALSHTARPPSP